MLRGAGRFDRMRNMKNRSPALLFPTLAVCAVLSVSCGDRSDETASGADASAPSASAAQEPAISAADLAMLEAERAEQAAREATNEGRAPVSEDRVVAFGRAGQAGKTVARNPYRGAIAVDADTGRILFQDNADELAIPASMVKMMDLLILQEMIEAGELRTNDVVAVSARAYGTGGSQVYLDPRESFPVEDLLYALMIQSANDAAVALAEHAAGSCEAMVERMNRRARELGMTATRFRTVHGLTEKSDPYFDVSSPRDMAILSRELCRHPEIFKYTGTAFRVFRDQASPNHIDMRTHNPVLQTGTRIPGADGLKTGYTKYAGYSLSASAARAGRRVIVVVMGVGVTDSRGDVIPKDSKRVRDRTISSLVERAFAELAAEPAGN